MRNKLLKRAVVMLLTLTMLVTGTGAAAFADSLGEGAENSVPETAEMEQAKEAAEEAEAVKEDAPAEEANKASEEAKDTTEAVKEIAENAKLTAKDWEAKLPASVSNDVREAMAQVAESQAGLDTALYTAFANAESLDESDAAFVMFVLEYANVLGVSKAIGDDSKGTVKNGDISIPVDADTEKWIKALEEADLNSEITEEVRPMQGDIVFVKGTAAVVAEAAEDGSFTLIGQRDAKDSEIKKYGAKSDAIDGFVSLRDLAPDQLADEAGAAATDDTAAEAADAGADTADAESAELTEEELAAKKAEEEAKEPTIEVIEDNKDAEGRTLSAQTITAKLTSAPGASGLLKSFGRKLSGADKNTEITITGFMPDGATINAFPVNVEVPGQTVVTAYDITIYDAEGNVYQPDDSVKVSIKDASLDQAASELNIYHMEDKDAKAELVTSTVQRAGAVSFDADSFSIYIVSSDEKLMTVTFMNGSDVYSKQVLKNGDKLQEPTSPVREGAVFKHWSATDNGTAYDGFGQSVTVTDNRTETLYAVYDTQKYTVTYYDQNGGIVETQMAESGASVDTTKVNYTPIQNQEGSHLKFLFWTKDPNAEVNSADAGTLNVTENTSLYPVVEPGHWIYFDVNKAAINNGDASYPAPEFVVAGPDNKPGSAGKPVSVSTCAGYTFNGWYTRKNGGDRVFDASGLRVEAGYNKITNNGELFNEPTLYAHWTKGTATYQVVYYVQKASDTVGGEKHYEFYKTGETRTDDVGAEVSLDNTKDTVTEVFRNSEDATKQKQDYMGFVLNTSKSKPVTVNADGTTVLAVYFDRNSFTLNFYNYDYGTGAPGGATSATLAVLQNYSNWARGGNSPYWRYANSTNKGIAKTITALYGHDISGEFPVKVYVNRSSSSQSSNQWTNTDAVCSNVAWKPTSDNQPDDSSGLTEEFKFIYTMPSQPSDRTSVSFLHNRAKDIPKTTYFYHEIIPGDEENGSVSDTVGSEYYRRGGIVYHLEKTMLHNYQILRKSAHYGNIYGLERFSDNEGIDGAEFDHSYGSSGGVSNINSPTSIFYKRSEHTLTLVNPTNNATVTKTYKYNQPIKKEELNKFAAENGVEEISSEDYWFYSTDFSDDSAVDFNNLRMPNYDITLYAGLKKFYIIQVDPAGGELFGKDGSSQGNNYSTWFRADPGTKVTEYGNITRDYIKAAANEATHKYEEYKYDPNDTSKPRTAKYVTASSDEAQYKYEKGAYVLTGWVKVNQNGTEEEYNFSNPVNSSFTLKAKWRRNANFRIVYDTANAAVSAPIDSNKYEDGAHAVAAESLDAPNGKRFTGWKDSKGTIYKPGQMIPVNEDIATMVDPGVMQIKLTAQYADYNPDSHMMADYTFMNGSTEYYTETIMAGEELIAPAAPTESGKVFDGWFLDSACTKRFDGFGIINNPIYTTLYAGFKEGCTVTYYNYNYSGNNHKGDTAITSQIYAKGEHLNTIGVTYTPINGYVVTGWTDGTTTYKYNYKTSSNVTSNMELWPVLVRQHTLTFDSKGGTYIAPVNIPADGRVGMPKEPEKKGFIFSGWFTDENCTEGNEYDFSTPLPSGMDTTLYAKWVADENNPAIGELTVLFWAQTPDRPEDDASDKTHYELANSYKFNKKYGEYTREQVTEFLRDEGVTISDPLVLNDVRARYHEADDDQFKAYFECDLDKTDGVVNVDSEKDNVLNVYFDRSEYTIKFNLNGVGSINYDGDSFTGTEYEITAWLDRPIESQWPILSSDRAETGEAYIVLGNNKTFSTWNAPEGSGMANATTLQLVSDRKMIDYAADPAHDKTLTYTAVETNSHQNVTALVHYYLNGEEKYSQEIKVYPNYRYDRTHDYTVFYATDTNGVKYYTALMAKDIDGYKNITIRSDSLPDNNYNPPVADSTGEYVGRAVRVGEGARNSTIHLYFYYKTRGYTLKLMETDSKEHTDPENPIVLEYGTQVSGENGYLVTHSNEIGTPDPPAAGLEFDCWSTTSAASVEYTANEGKMPAYGITLYARWKPIQVKVTTVSMGDGGDEYGPKDYNTPFEEFNIPEPTKDGYIFMGWHNADTDKWISPKEKITCDIRVKPAWRANNKRRVVYNANGGTPKTGSAPADTNLYDIDSTIAILDGSALIASQTSTIDGIAYDGSFVCWNTRADGKGTNYFYGDSIKIGDQDGELQNVQGQSEQVRTVTLYAQYSSYRETTLTYDKNGDNAELIAKTASERAPFTAKLEANKTLKLRFKDYSINANTAGIPNTMIKVGYDTGKADGIEFIARRPGYKFNGWSTSSTGPQEAKNGDSAYVNTLAGSNTLYAVWDGDTLPVVVKTYEDDNIAGAVPVENSDNTYQQTTVDNAAKDIPALETAYKGQLDTAYVISEGFEFDQARIEKGNTSVVVDKLQYVLNDAGTGYEWQYHAKEETDATEFLPVVDKTLTIYYRKLNNADLTISKTISGKYADMTRKFTFTINVEGDAAGTTYNKTVGTTTSTIQNGGTFELGHGDSVTINVPKNRKITITETAVGGYTPKYTGDQHVSIQTGTENTVDHGVVVKINGQGGTLSVENEFDDGSVVPSGIAGNTNMLMLIVLAFALATAEFYILIRRRRFNR